MVIGLISAESDINAADNNGKTALHWAAAISNIEAVKQLLKNGANKDAQDERVSFLVSVLCFFNVYSNGTRNCLMTEEG